MPSTTKRQCKKKSFWLLQVNNNYHYKSVSQPTVFEEHSVAW